MTLKEDYQLFLVDIIFEYLFIDFPLHLSIHHSVLFILHMILATVHMAQPTCISRPARLQMVDGEYALVRGC